MHISQATRPKDFSAQPTLPWRTNGGRLPTPKRMARTMYVSLSQLTASPSCKLHDRLSRRVPRSSANLFAPHAGERERRPLQPCSGALKCAGRALHDPVTHPRGDFLALFGERQQGLEEDGLPP